MVLSFLLVGGCSANAQSTTLTKSSGSSLASTSSTTSTLSLGSAGASVTALQNVLITKGYLTTKANGSFDINTKMAVEKFQKANGLEVDGKCGPKTMQSLNKSQQGSIAENGNEKSLAPLPNNPQANNNCSVTNVAVPYFNSPFLVGQTTQVTWSSTCPSTDLMEIRLRNPAGQGITVGPNNIYNTGSTTITIPTPTYPLMTYPYTPTTTYGNIFKVNVIDLTTGAATISGSSGLFAINSRPILNVARDPSDPASHVVMASATNDTWNVTQSVIDLTATGGSINVSRLPVTINVTNAGTGGMNPNALISTLRLYAGTNTSGNPLDTEMDTTTAGGTVNFQNLNINLIAGSGPHIFTITGDVNSINGSVVVNGATSKISITPTNVANIQAYDVNNNVVSGPLSLTGSTTGSTIAYYTNGPMVNETSDNCGAMNATITGTPSTLTCIIGYNITANGAPVYIPKAGLVTSTAMGSVNAIDFQATSSTGTPIPFGPSLTSNAVIAQVGTNATSSDAGLEWTIPAGVTATFTGTVVITDVGSTHPGSYRAFLNNLSWGVASGTWGNGYSFGLGATNPVVPPYEALQ